MLSASSVVCPWQRETLPLSTAGCYLGTFWALVLYRLGSPAWGLDPTHLRGKPSAIEIFFQHFSCHPLEPSQPSHISSTLRTSHVVVQLFLLSVRGYKTSLLLFFICLFCMTSPQFSYNSTLVLGGRYCSFHSLLQHLGSLWVFVDLRSTDISPFTNLKESPSHLGEGICCCRHQSSLFFFKWGAP